MSAPDMDKPSQRKIPHTLRNSIGTTAAGTPQHRAALLHPHESVERRRRRKQITHSSPPENDPRAAAVSKCTFVFKADVTNPSAQPLFSPVKIAVKNALRCDPAAQHIHHRQMIVTLSQKMTQTVTLTGGSCKQHRHALLQIGPHGGKHAVRVALHRLNAFHRDKFRCRRRTHMSRMKILIKNAAVHHTAPRYHMLSQKKKEAPRVRADQRTPVLCLGRVIQGLKAVRHSLGGVVRLPAQRTHLITSAAADTPLRVDGRIDEFISVSDFNHSKLRACFHTCAAACTVFMVDFQQNAISSK